MKELQYVPKAEVKEYKQEMDIALQNVLNKLMNENFPGFQISLVGSTKRNLVLTKGKSNYDVDYKLILFKQGETKASYRNEIFMRLSEELNNNWKIYNSKSVITAKKFKGNVEVKSFDIALADHVGGEVYISKLDKNSNNYIWNKIASSEEHVQKLGLIKEEMWDFLREEYKHLKSIEWDKPVATKKSSNSVFVEAVNNTYNHFYK